MSDLAAKVPEAAKRKQDALTDEDENTSSENSRHARPKDEFDVEGVVNVASSDDEGEDESDDDKVGDLVISRPASKEEILERKPTLDPDFMKRLTVPDEKDDEAGDRLFETNQAPTMHARGSAIATRRTGFESWLKTKTSAKSLYGAETSESKILLAFKNLSLDVTEQTTCCPRSFREHCQNFNGDCLDLGVDDATRGYPVLRGISSVMLAGKTTLVIGPPDAGTTTLLRTLAGRLNAREDIRYDFCISENGPVDLKDWCTRRTSAFVSADDHSHVPTLTVRETMEVAARLTMGERPGQTIKEREADLNELVDRVVESLGLSDQADTIVGDHHLRGVSGGQKRRVTLGEMLFSRDAKLLFLDDITNGLDSSKAQQVVRIIRSACRVLGFSAMVSLLQPNDMLFDAFDDVLVLSNKGEMVFTGPTAEAVPYFETLLERTGGEDSKDWTRPSGMAAAEYILMAVTSLQEIYDAKPELGTLSAKFLDSSDGNKLLDKLNKAEKHVSQEAREKASTTALPTYATSSWNQIKVLTWRKLLLISRNPMTLRRVIVAVAFGIVIGTLFSSLKQDMIGALARSGFFFLSIFLVMMLSTAVTVTDNHAMRLIFYKQHGSAFHSAWTYHLANFICDLPLAVIESLVLAITTYWWAGLRVSDAGGFFYFFAVLLAMEFVGQAVSRVIAALCPTVIMAQLIASGYILLCGLMGGFMPHYSDIPRWWQWINWITPVSYAQEGLVLNNYVAGGQGDALYPVLVIPSSNSTDVKLGQISGAGIASAMGQPRIPFSDATAGLNSVGKVMAFDFGMLLVFGLVFDILGLASLILSQRWYEPWSRRSIQTTSAKSTRREINKLLGGIKTQFHSLKSEELRVAKESKAATSDDKDHEDPALPSGNNESQAPLLSSYEKNDETVVSMTLAVIEMNYFVPDPSPAKENTGSKASNASNHEAPNEQTAESKTSSKLERALSSVRDAASSRKATGFQDVLHTEDRRAGENLAWSFERFYAWVLLKLNLFGGRHKPKPGPPVALLDDVDMLPAEERIQLAVHRPRSDSKRGRAWSNKLPLGEEEDPVENGGPKPGEIQLLQSVTGVFRTGETTALMGQSGCGKTTLLDVIAGYKTGGRIKGDMYLNGNKVTSKDLRNFLGYAEQMDLHNPVLSVHESLMFAAACRFPNSVTREERERMVGQVMDILQITEFRNVVVGQEDASEGLAKHARKRLTIGVELVAKPRILFLDEPTTGLDSLGAEIVMGAITDVARRLQVAVVATIHQPSRAVFGRFDRLLFLKRGGQVIYNGPVSSFRPFDEESGLAASVTTPDASQSKPNNLVPISGSGKDWRMVNVVQRQPSGLQAISEESAPTVLMPELQPAPTVGDIVLAYFAGMGAPPLKQGFNPADHLLIAVETLEENGVDVADLFEDSPEMKEVWADINVSTKNPTPLPPVEPRASYMKQLSVLLWRAFLSQWRDPKFTLFRFFWYAFCALFLGTTFFRLGCGIQGAIFRIAALFFAVYAAIVPMQVAVMPLVKERAVVYRELASDTYSAWIDGIARLLADIPFHIIMAVIFYAIFYYAVRLSFVPERTGYFILMIFFSFWMFTSFGQAVAMLSPNIETANGLAGLVILLSTFLMGFLIPSRLMPKGWRWTLWINMLAYVLQGLCVNELGDQWFQVNLGEERLPCGPMQLIDIPDLTSQSSHIPATLIPGKSAGYLRASVLESYTSATVPSSPSVTDHRCIVAFENVLTDGENLLQCLERYKCFDSTSLELCMTIRCSRSALRFFNSVQAAIDCIPEPLREPLFEKVVCIIGQIENEGQVLTCFPRVKEIIDFLDKYGEVIHYLLPAFKKNPAFFLSWFLYLIAYQIVYIPGNLILYFFEWAEFSGDGTGFVADTKWWYCMFAVAMFIVGWELIKILGRRYVIWVKR